MLSVTRKTGCKKVALFYFNSSRKELNMQSGHHLFIHNSSTFLKKLSFHHKMSQSKQMLFLCVSISLNIFITEGQALPWRFGQSVMSSKCSAPVQASLIYYQRTSLESSLFTYRGGCLGRQEFNSRSACFIKSCLCCADSMVNKALFFKFPEITVNKLGELSLLLNDQL